MNTSIMQQPQLSNSRLLLLGVSSVILATSFIMSIFAPFPVALAIILYGRVKGWGVGLLGAGLCFLFATFAFRDLTLFFFYVSVLVFGFGIGEIVQRNLSPIKGIVIFGLGFMLTLGSGVGLFVKSKGLTLEQYILEQLEKNADKINEQKKIVENSQEPNLVEALNYLNNPKLMVKEFLDVIPSYFFIGVFLMLWFNMFLVLKSRRLLFSGQDHPFTEKDLLNFKVPFPLVFLLIIGLVLALFADQMGFKNLETWGFTIIKCLGLFYFFQGFGIFSDFLSFVGVRGFFRTLIVMVIVFMANYLISAVGLFDNWLDFRKYFNKQKTNE